MVIIYFSHIFHVVDELMKQGLVVLSPKWLESQMTWCIWHVLAVGLDALNPVLSGTSCLSSNGTQLIKFPWSYEYFFCLWYLAFKYNPLWKKSMWLFQLSYFHYIGTITAFYFLGWILLQNCQKLWFRNGIQKISSPVASCETAFSVLNTEHLLLFLRATLLYLPVKPGRVPAFGSIWSAHHVNRITQTANNVF